MVDACRDRGLDPATVSVLLDALDGEGDGSVRDWSQATIAELSDHIVDVHHAYLRRELPRLTELLAKCERAHGAERPELAETRATFERLRVDLEQHVADEEETLFPACRRQKAGDPPDAVLLNAFERFEAEHTATGALLGRLRR